MIDATLDESLLLLPVQGRNLAGANFGECLEPRGTLICFLRHLGCVFSRETVAELHAASKQVGYPSVLFVHQGSAEEGRRLFDRAWPEAAAIADPMLRLYRAFDVRRGTMRELFGPETLVCGIRGLLKGHGIGRPVGDPMRMPGLFHVKDARVTWIHDYRHAGDHPDFKRIPDSLGAWPEAGAPSHHTS